MAAEPHAVDSAVSLPPDLEAGAMPVGAEDSSSAPRALQGRFARGEEGYLSLVWRRFRRSVVGMIGLVLVSALIIISIFGDFFAPVDPKLQLVSFQPPDYIAFQDSS